MPQKKAVTKAGNSANTSSKQHEDRIPPDVRKLALNLLINDMQKLLRGSKPGLSPLNAGLAEARSSLKKIVLGSRKPSRPDSNIALSYFSSQTTLPGYCTLDSDHVSDIQELVSNITKYAVDPTKTRPLTALMIASPGAGKSHFINCLAERLRAQGVVPITYNMTAMERNEDLSQALDSARNLKVADKLPLIFLDEFDGYPRSCSLLLPLLWEGQMHFGHRDLKLGKVIIVLAGSKPRVSKLMELAQGMQLNADASADSGSEDAKLVDLLSRINAGTIRIPSLDLTEDGRDRRIDKICISIALLTRRFGDQLEEVPRSLLKFIALTEFRYGVRSIAHVIDLIPRVKEPTALIRARLHLPLSRLGDLRKSSLAYHLIDREQGHAVIELWKDCGKNDVALRVGKDALVELVTAKKKPRTARASKSAK